MTAAADIVAVLVERHLTIAVAESLTGGLLVAELISVPGASQVVRGGVVAYATELKHSILGVSAGVLAAHGPVHPDVALQMAGGVRTVASIEGVPADIGISTTGVAGPGPQDGHPAGTVFIGIVFRDQARIVGLELGGDREGIRKAVVSESLSALEKMLSSG